MAGHRLLQGLVAAQLQRERGREAGGAEVPLGRQPRAPTDWRKRLHESFTDGSQLLSIGAMAVGLMTGEAGREAMQPFVDHTPTPNTDTLRQFAATCSPSQPPTSDTVRGTPQHRPANQQPSHGPAGDQTLSPASFTPGP